MRRQCPFSAGPEKNENDRSASSMRARGWKLLASAGRPRWKTLTCGPGGTESLCLTEGSVVSSPFNRQVRRLRLVSAGL